MTVTYTISNTVNFESPGFVLAPGQNSFPSIWGNREFSFVVTFSPSDGNTQILNADVLSFPEFTIVEDLGGLSFRITQIDDPFDEWFEFFRFEGDGQVVEILEEPLPYSSVVNWNTPETEILTDSYLFDFGANSSISFSQNFHWDFSEGLNRLEDYVIQSRF